MNWRETLTPATACPWCGYKIDAASSADPRDPEATPSPGDFSICLECASPLFFTEGLGLRKPTPEEERMLNRDPVYRRARRTILDLDRRRK